MSGSVLLVEVPEADPVVHAHRLELDPVARPGVPAHVTALFPFVPTTGLGPDVLAAFRDHPPCGGRRGRSWGRCR